MSAFHFSTNSLYVRTYAYFFNIILIKTMDWNLSGIFSHNKREGNLTNMLFSYESVDKDNFLNRF